VKELEEVKKAVEVRVYLFPPYMSLMPLQFSEADRAAVEARDLAEREKLDAERLIIAIAEAEVRTPLGGSCAGRDHFYQSLTFDKVSRLLHFLRLHASLSSRHPSVSPLGLDDSEIEVVLAAAERLLGEESEIRQVLIRGILSGEGEFEGISRESSGLELQGPLLLMC
jgi:hypothetical protein